MRFGRESGIATGSSDDPEGQWGTDGGQNSERYTKRLPVRRGIRVSPRV